MSREIARAWAEIDLAALRHNAEVARRLAGGRRVMAVVKANAYGHGVIPVARELEHRVDMFGVAGLHEAEEIREEGIGCPIFLLGTSLPAELPGIVELEKVVVTVSSREEAEALSHAAVRRGRRIEIHASIDTGMGRIGFLPEAWTRSLIAELSALPGVRLTGVTSHLPSADEDEGFTRNQLEKFRALAAASPGLDSHVANSAGLIGYGEGAIGDIVRPGLLLYGSAPIPRQDLDLRPVMSLKSWITLVRQMPAGSSISYGRSFVTREETRVATVSVGYGDGYRRHLSGRGAEVLVRGSRCAVLGTVTMDQIMVDVSHLPDVAPGDEVLLFGKAGEGRGGSLPVEEIAEKAGTIPWEIFTGITPRVKRFYSDSWPEPERVAGDSGDGSPA